MRALLEDPEKRAKALSDYRKNEESQLPRQVLDLGEDDYNRLLDTLGPDVAKLQLAKRYDCNVPHATRSKNQMQANRRELVELLGTKGSAPEDYRDNYQERNNVASFRSDLPDSLRLMTRRLKSSWTSLARRRRMIKEWELRGARYSGMANMYGSLYPRLDAGPEHDSPKPAVPAPQRERRAV